ncbi:MAG: hypothetical protein WC043_07415 [Pseudobdellovibrionaceae bacterium]
MNAKRDFLIGAAIGPFLGGMTIGQMIVGVSGHVDSPVWGKRLYNVGNTLAVKSVDGLNWAGRQLEKTGVMKDTPESSGKAFGFAKTSRAFIAGIVTSGAVCIGGAGLVGYGVVEGAKAVFNQVAPGHSPRGGSTRRHAALESNSAIAPQDYTPVV